MPRIQLGDECPVCGTNMDANEMDNGLCFGCELKGYSLDPCTGAILFGEFDYEVECE